MGQVRQRDACQAASYTRLLGLLQGLSLGVLARASPATRLVPAAGGCIGFVASFAEGRRWTDTGRAGFVSPTWGATPCRRVVRTSASGDGAGPEQRQQQQQPVPGVADLATGQQEASSRPLMSFEVVEVPSYEQMLAWARAKDREVAARKIYGLGGVLAEGAHEVALKPLGESDGAQLKELMALLERRLAGQKAFLPNEMEKLRDAVGRLEQVVKEDTAFLVKAKELQQGRRGGRRGRLGAGGGAWAPDPVYGSKEVREVVYLFVWSLLRQRGSHLLSEEEREEQERRQEGQSHEEDEHHLDHDGQQGGPAGADRHHDQQPPPQGGKPNRRKKGH